ncbi:MAG: RNA polymerase subunit sigma-70 [Phycicoccus sp.]|nr:RNA polymerase subunit sigma-70 [Phycicoccus sp.]
MATVLIGDVVDSRSSRDRAALHARLVAVLAEVGADGSAIEPPVVTVGDEFQARYAALGPALAAAFRIRVSLLPDIDVRIGIGAGETVILDPQRGIGDGPGWWAARAAVEAAESDAATAGHRGRRTAYRSAVADDRVDAVNAALECQDHLVGLLSSRSLTILRGLMNGTTQAEVAHDEGISPSAVSQRIRADGIAVITESARLLARLS